MLRPFLSLALSLIAVACASTHGSSGPGEPMRVTLLTYRNPVQLELVSEAHTDRLTQYSAIRPNANRKVQTNEVMTELVHWLEENGFERLAIPGAAPLTADETTFWSLEIEGKEGTSHVTLSKRTPQADVQSCLKLKNDFVETYNATYGLQAVKVKQGETPFKTPETPRKGNP